MTIVVGKLRHRIVIQEYMELKDDWGGSYKKWLPTPDPADTDYDANALAAATVWARVSPARGREFWDIRKSNSEVEGMVVVRYRPGIDHKNRLLFGDRILEILYIRNPEEKNEILEIYYKEQS